MIAGPKPRALSPAERAKATKEAFEAKVLILEQWACDGIPEHEDFYPKNHATLRAWTGPKYKELAECQRPDPLGTWSDPMIDRPTLGSDQRPIGKYPDLILRYRAAITRIEERLKRKAGRLPSFKAEIDYLKKQAIRLSEQNDYLIGEIDRLEFELSVAKDLEKGHKRTIDMQALEIREMSRKIRDLHAILEYDATRSLEDDDDTA